MGKSTLINRLLHEERLLTGPEPGVTRDAIAVDWVWKGQPVRLVDTAGLRRRARVQDPIERLSAADTDRAIRFAEVVVLLLDAADGLERQDLSIAARTIEEGRALVLAANKWDLVRDAPEVLGALRDRIETSLPQVRDVPLLTVSAVSGRGVDRLVRTAFESREIWSRRISTGALNRWLREALEAHPPPIVKGRRLKLRYAAQVKRRPPTVAIFGSRPAAVPESYVRYLANGLRRDFRPAGRPHPHPAARRRQPLWPRRRSASRPCALPRSRTRWHGRVFAAGRRLAVARYRIFGSELSPYSVKVRGWFRYKGIAHDWLTRTPENRAEYDAHARLPLVPLVITPEGAGIQDSTPIMERFEAAFPEPATQPVDPMLAFLSALLEEYGDEWGNKHMFHYRWARRRRPNLGGGAYCPQHDAGCERRRRGRARPGGARAHGIARQLRRLFAADGADHRGVLRPTAGIAGSASGRPPLPVRRPAGLRGFRHCGPGLGGLDRPDRQPARAAPHAGLVPADAGPRGRGAVRGLAGARADTHAAARRGGRRPVPALVGRQCPRHR